ncbi:MAG TPA: DUF1007 family protein [Rhizobiaceae bacterium]|nr:DUF1007 family protein [Rhizobiaceae bacterium]
MIFARTTFATALAGTALAALSALPAVAHPHVFAEARLDVAVNPDNTVKALKHLWRFDDVFSSTVLIEFDANSDLKLDDAELQEVANTVYTSLAEYDYFQLVTQDKKDVAMKPPAKLIATFEDQQLIIMFESEPKEALKLGGQVDFGVYDPTFYTAIDFVEDDYMQVQNMPAGCTRAVIRPDPDEAIAQNQDMLDQSFWDTTSSNDMQKLFATRLEITCKGLG